jgi:dihydroorotate dehydrogenase (fumarate)
MDMTTKYLGIELPHPFMAGASPLADSLDSVKRLEDMGVAAVVLRSLFEEQIDAEAMATHHSMESHAESFGEATSYFADPIEFVIGPDDYLEHLREVVEATDIPIIGSLNGHTLGGWLGYAKAIQEAGAAALELNVYQVALDEERNGHDYEREIIEMVSAIRGAISIPIAVKLSPFFTSLPNLARTLEEAGADGFVLFNRFFENDIDVENLEVISQMQLSDSRELLLRLRWLAILSAQLQRASLAASGGIHTTVDAVKAIMCGADALQLVAAILKKGPTFLQSIRHDLATWMIEREYESIAQMKGSMNLSRSPNPQEYSRVNYMKMLQTWQP